MASRTTFEKPDDRDIFLLQKNLDLVPVGDEKETFSLTGKVAIT